MILVDSSVIFDHTRNRDPRLAGWFKTNPVAVCGVVRAEVPHGARNAGDRANLEALLNRFAQVPIPEATWDTVGDHLAVLRSNGLTVPFPDAVLATVAVVNNIELWTRDAHFPLIQKWLPALQLFQEPP
ncbi:MAG: PIN domain-containing protein [Zavarzinella sp.]|nr:PIN domain-containing protein [Zavarzinella sp.]